MVYTNGIKKKKLRVRYKTMRLNHSRDWFYLLVGGDWLLGTIAGP